MAKKAFVAKACRGQAFFFLIASSGFVLLGLWMAGAFGDAFPVWEQGLGWITATIFGLAAANWGWSLLRGGIAYRFDEDGLYDGRFGKKFSWDQIRHAEFRVSHARSRRGLFRTKVSRRLIVYDVDPEIDLEISHWKSMMQDWQFGLSGNSNAISDVGTEKTFAQIAAGFRRFAPERLQPGPTPQVSTISLDW